MSDNLEKDNLVEQEDKAPAKTKEKKKERFTGVKTSVRKVTKFFTDVKSEMKKIVWPSRKQVVNNTVIVLVVVAVVGLFLFGLDSGMRALLDLVL